MIEVIDCYSWSDFKQQLKEKVYRDQRMARGSYLFRGQGDSEWELATYFDRAFASIKKDKRKKLEKKLIENFKKECEVDEEYKSLLADEIMTLALAQHYRLPTRLLDWSESPYVAAFFAFQGHFYSSIFNTSVGTEVAIWVLDKNSYIWTKEYGVQLISTTLWKNERLRKQYGWFTLSNTPFLNLEEYVDKFEDTEEALRKMVLPATQAGEAIADLDLMGINHSSLFPDLEGKARAAVVKTLLSL